MSEMTEAEREFAVNLNRDWFYGTVVHALCETNLRDVLDFIDAVERDCGPETARRVSALRDAGLEAAYDLQHPKDVRWAVEKMDAEIRDVPKYWRGPDTDYSELEDLQDAWEILRSEVVCREAT